MAWKTIWLMALINWGIQNHVCWLFNAQNWITSPAVGHLSKLTEACHICLGLESVAKAENQIHKGQAHDHLDDVRWSIQTYNHHISIKANDVCGQCYVTQARSIVDNLNADTQKAANTYNITCNALLKLGLDPKDPLLKPLLTTKLWAKNATMPPKLGDLRKEDPWFLHVACPAGLSAEEKAEFYLESECWLFNNLIKIAVPIKCVF